MLPCTICTILICRLGRQPLPGSSLVNTSRHNNTNVVSASGIARRLDRRPIGLVRFSLPFIPALVAKGTRNRENNSRKVKGLNVRLLFDSAERIKKTCTANLPIPRALASLYVFKGFFPRPIALSFEHSVKFASSICIGHRLLAYLRGHLNHVGMTLQLYHQLQAQTMSISTYLRNTTLLCLRAVFCGGPGATSSLAAHLPRCSH